MNPDTNPRADEETKTTTAEGAAPTPAEGEPKPKKRRGFAAMDRNAVREIARKGGVAAHERGTAHRFTAEEARDAGRKGGRAPHKTRGHKIARAKLPQQQQQPAPTNENGNAATG